MKHACELFILITVITGRAARGRAVPAAAELPLEQPASQQVLRALRLLPRTSHPDGPIGEVGDRDLRGRRRGRAAWRGRGGAWRGGGCRVWCVESTPGQAAGGWRGARGGANKPLLLVVK